MKTSTKYIAATALFMGCDSKGHNHLGIFDGCYLLGFSDYLDLHLTQGFGQCRDDHSGRFRRCSCSFCKVAQGLAVHWYGDFNHKTLHSALVTNQLDHCCVWVDRTLSTAMTHGRPMPIRSTEFPDVTDHPVMGVYFDVFQKQEVGGMLLTRAWTGMDTSRRNHEKSSRSPLLFLD